MSEWHVIRENFHTKHSVFAAPDEHIIQLHIMSIRWSYYEQMKQQNIWPVHILVSEKKTEAVNAYLIKNSNGEVGGGGGKRERSTWWWQCRCKTWSSWEKITLPSSAWWAQRRPAPDWSWWVWHWGCLAAGNGHRQWCGTVRSWSSPPDPRWRCGGCPIQSPAAPRTSGERDRKVTWITAS